MQEQRNDLDYGMHVESFEPAVEIREDTGADDECGTQFGLILELPGSLLDQRCDESARETEPQTNEPKRVAN